MEDRTWDRIVDAIDLKYGITKHGRDTRPVADAMHLTESVAYICFTREGEDYKLERIAGPAILDRRTVGGRRPGASVHYETSYDPDETAFRTLLYRHDHDDWAQIDPSELGL